MDVIQLQQVSTDTFTILSQLWDEMGVKEEERTEFLAQLTSDVIQVFIGRVNGQTERKENVLSEISTLQKTINSILCSMEEPGSAPENTNLPFIEYRNLLESTRKSLQEKWDAKFNTLKSLENKLFGLYADVGYDIHPTFVSIGSKVSVDRITAYETEVNRIKCDKDRRQETIHQLCDEITSLWSELSYIPKEDNEKCIQQRGSGMNWSDKTIQFLQSKVKQYADEKAIREEKIMQIGQNITALWKRLSTPEEEQTQFLEAHAGIGDEVIQACQEYLEKKQQEFASRLVDLITNARTSLKSIWTEMRMTEEQCQQAFPAYYLDVSHFNDDLFFEHENAISMFTKEVEEMRPLLKAIEKRESILGEKSEYESIIADPNRLIKGSSAARLREEKLERRIKKELPAINKRLREQAVEWEQAHNNKEFSIDGQRLITILDDEQAAEAKAKGEARQQRESRTNDNTTNASNNATTAPTNNAATTATGAPRATSVSRVSTYRLLTAGASTTGRLAVSASSTTTNATKKTSVPASTTVVNNENNENASSDATVKKPIAADAPSVPVLTNTTKPNINTMNSTKHVQKQSTSRSSSVTNKTISTSSVTVSNSASQETASMLQAM